MPLPGDRLYANSIWIGPANGDNMMVGRSGYGIYGSVQHHSAGTLQALIYRFTHPPAISGGGASAHFAIDREEETRDGLLGFGQYAIRYQLVDTADTAFADANYWENLTTVAVEHVRQWGSGPGTPGYEPITSAQYRSSHELQLILSADNGYPLNSTTITPHNAYAQTTCPGDLDLNRVISGEGGPEVLDPNDPTVQLIVQGIRNCYAEIEVIKADVAKLSGGGASVDLSGVTSKLDALGKHLGVGTA